jgi:integrase
MQKPRRWREAVAGNPAVLEALQGLGLEGQNHVGKQREALHYKDVHAFLQLIRQEPYTAMRALEFIILTGLRVSEVVGAKWCEIDWTGDWPYSEDVPTWHVPAERKNKYADYELCIANMIYVDIDP